MKKKEFERLTFAALMTVFMAAGALGVSAQNADALIPSPAERHISNGLPFTMDGKTLISYDGGSQELKQVAQLLAGYLADQTGIHFQTTVKSNVSSNVINLVVNPESPTLLQKGHTYGTSPKSADIPDERYSLEVKAEAVNIVGATPEAVFRGCTTLRQLVGVVSKADKVQLPSQLIKDAPTFAWRELSLDVSRYFVEADDVKTIIDMLSLYKMNVLHFHLTDNQGWRMEIKSHPELTTVGGFVENNGRKGGFYTQEQYSELVRYAAERQVTIVPELDLPGHTGAVFQAYPNLTNAAKLPLEINLPGQYVSALDPEDPAAIKLVEDALTEVAALTPGRYIHIGGDETFGMPDDKFAAFVKKARAIVKKLGKEVVGWQEMARSEVSSGDVLQNWITYSADQSLTATEESDSNDKPAMTIPKELRDMLATTYMKAPSDIPAGIAGGAKILLTPGTNTYMDYPYKEESADPGQSADRQRLGLFAYARHTIQETYDWNPITFIAGCDWTKAIAGVGCTIFCETVESFKDMQFLVLPRMTGIAEKSWSADRPMTWDAYSRNLAGQSQLWRLSGWNFFKSSLIDWR